MKFHIQGEILVPVVVNGEGVVNIKQATERGDQKISEIAERIEEHLRRQAPNLVSELPKGWTYRVIKAELVE